MKISTWLSGAAFVALLIYGATAQAGELFIAHMDGGSVVPPSGSSYTGNAYFAFDTGYNGGTFYVYHNVPTPTAIQLRLGYAGDPGSLWYTFKNLGMNNGRVVEPVVINSPAFDKTSFETSYEFLEIFNAAYPGGAIRGQFALVKFSGQGTTARQKAISNMLDLAPSNSDDRSEVLMVDLAQASLTPSGAVLDEFSGRALYAQNEEVLDGLLDVETAAFAHVSESKAPVDIFSTYIKGGYGAGHRRGTADQPGSKISRPYFLAGIDYGLTENTLVGLAGGYVGGVNKFKDGLSRDEVGTITGTAYFATQIKGLEFQIVGEYGGTEIKTERHFTFSTTVAGTHHAANSYAMAVKVAYPIHVQSTWTVGPYALFDVQHVNIKGYTEDNIGALGLVVPAVKSTNTGGEFGAVLQAPLGAAMQVRMEGGYRLYLNQGNNAAIPVSFNITPSPTIYANLLERDKGAGRFGLSLWGTDGGYLFGEVGYNGHYSKRTLEHMLNVRFGIRI